MASISASSMCRNCLGLSSLAQYAIRSCTSAHEIWTANKRWKLTVTILFPYLNRCSTSTRSQIIMEKNINIAICAWYSLHYQRGESGLASGGHEDQGGFLRRVLPDGGVGGLVHRGHARAVVLAGVALCIYSIYTHSEGEGTDSVAALIYSYIII